MADCPHPPTWVSEALRSGLVIPAHPLALTAARKFDERRQRALTRYYHAAGAGGIAVGVHTTQFEIRRPEHGLFKPVLELAAGTVAACDAAAGRRTVRIAGICGPTAQAASEAVFAREVGYAIGLLSLGALRDADDAQLIAHCEAVAREIPVMGFYLQPAAGGRLLGIDFWRRFVTIPNVVAIKIAPFNRYQTLDVIRAVAETGRAAELALYTGNDDAIVLDLLTRYEIGVPGNRAQLGMAGGLLGHWACWTRQAVNLLDHCKHLRGTTNPPPEMLTTNRKDGFPAVQTPGGWKAAVPGAGAQGAIMLQGILTLAAQVTDANAAFFDAAHGFAGCIAGIHEVLRRQGLLANTLCLNPSESLSPGQAEEIDRVYRAYPDLNDDDFVQAHLDEWLS